MRCNRPSGMYIKAGLHSMYVHNKLGSQTISNHSLMYSNNSSSTETPHYEQTKVNRRLPPALNSFPEPFWLLGLPFRDWTVLVRMYAPPRRTDRNFLPVGKFRQPVFLLPGVNNLSHDIPSLILHRGLIPAEKFSSPFDALEVGPSWAMFGYEVDQAIFFFPRPRVRLFPLKGSFREVKEIVVVVIVVVIAVGGGSLHFFHFFHFLVYAIPSWSDLALRSLRH
jgi:hypothetical protein